MTFNFENEFKKYKTQADFVSFKLVREKTRDILVRNGQADEMSYFDDYGLMIEVIKNHHIGYSGTCELSSEGIKKAFDKAVQMTQKSSAHKVFNFNLNVRPIALGQYVSARQKSLDQVSLAEIYDFLKQTSLQIKKHHKDIITAVADAMVIECEQTYLSSAGSHFQQNFNIVVNSFSSTAKNHQDTQTRTLHGGRGNCLQIGAEFFNLEKNLQKCELVAQESIDLLSAENCPSETCDLILAPDQMLLQIHESIGHPLELDRILGDERNFAGWSFVKPTDFGHLQYGSDLMNVVFEPDVPHELASYKFDEVGNPATRKPLIEKGILKAGLGSLESQMRSGLSGVANSRASSWNRAPIDRMANINLLPGNLSLQQMIEKVENGIIMHSNRSWSIDDYRRKFQFGCEYAQKIENGRIVKILKNPNYRGVTVPFWNKLTGLTTADTIESYGSPYCGKGEPSQIIRVGHASPYALFKDVEVFGR